MCLIGAIRHIRPVPHLGGGLALSPAAVISKSRRIEVISARQANKLCSQGCKSFLIMVRAGHAQPPFPAAHASVHAVSKDQTNAGKTQTRHRPDQTQDETENPDLVDPDIATSPQHNLIPEDRQRAYRPKQRHTCRRITSWFALRQRRATRPRQGISQAQSCTLCCTCACNPRPKQTL